jgi:hypothetical protein
MTRRQPCSKVSKLEPKAKAKRSSQLHL